MSEAGAPTALTNSQPQSQATPFARCAARKERGILFSAPMVRAILAGKKTQTRRVVAKPNSYERIRDCGFLCPYGVPGDRLWVRETWATDTHNCDEDWQHEDEDHRCNEHCQQTYVYYRATPRVGYRPIPDKARITFFDESTPLPPTIDDRKWKPSIFMPRWASRITLEVTEVSVQRVQEISEDDARAEGVQPFGEAYSCVGIDQRLTDGTLAHERPYRGSYAVLWDEINGDRPGCLWKDNPWCWAVSFKTVST